MSGGSHGYMGRCYGMDDVLQKVGWLPDIAGRLDELGHPAAARATRELYERLTAEPEHFAALVKVWGAIDYLDSGDYGPESVAEAVEAWWAAVRLDAPGAKPTSVSMTALAAEVGREPKEVQSAATRLMNKGANNMIDSIVAIPDEHGKYSTIETYFSEYGAALLREHFARD